MQTPQLSPSPEPIVNVAIGYMAAKQLFAASRVGLFTALHAGPATVPELAEATGVSVRIARILADAMAGIGLITRADHQYSLTPAAAEYLTGKHAGLDLAPFLKFLNEISYGHWLQFDATVDSSQPGKLAMDEARWATFLGGVMTYNALHAKLLVQGVDFTGFGTVLDLGGLSSAFSIEAMLVNPKLEVTFLFDPQMIGSVSEALHEAGLAERATVIGVPTVEAEPAGQFDLVMVNHVVHRFDAEQNLAILRRARSAAAAGGRLLLLDFFLDDDPQQRAIDALHAGEYFVIDGTVVYPEQEVRDWLASAGWSVVDKVALAGSPRVLVAEAV